MSRKGTPLNDWNDKKGEAMKTNKGPNWQGVLVMIGIVAWTLNNIHAKITKPETGESWWVVTAPISIFAGMVIAIYLVTRLSMWVGRRSGLSKS